VINNEPLLEMARVFQEGGNPEPPARFPHPPRRRFHQALEAVRKLPPDQWPKRRLPKRTARHPEAEPRFDHLKLHRDRVAVELDLDGALIASRGALEEIAQDAGAAGQLLPWQRGLMEPALERLATVAAPVNGHPPRRDKPRNADRGEVKS
jgi:hypothetical protein